MTLELNHPWCKHSSTPPGTTNFRRDKLIVQTNHFNFNLYETDSILNLTVIYGGSDYKNAL